ncbi:MAG: hypothetical protein KAH22_08245 [Thiotrichaceae bacterium]|nr:hypothetical protein [Thiotrichaceae bacterium]
MSATTFRLTTALLLTLSASSSFAEDKDKDIIFKNGSKALSLYEDAHEHASVIAKIPRGANWLLPTSFKNYTSGRWVQVEYHGKKGWARFARLIVDKAAMKLCKNKKTDQRCKIKK